MSAVSAVLGAARAVTLTVSRDRRRRVATGRFTVEPLSLRRAHVAKVTAASRLRDMEPVESRRRYHCRYRLGRSSNRSSQWLLMITHLSARELLTLHEFKFHSLLLLEL